MACIAIEKVTVGKGAYRIAAYDPGASSASDGLMLRFEMVNDGRLIDLTLSRQELDLIADFRREKVGGIPA